MARVNIYLPDDLAAQAKAADLNLSALAQDAVRRSLGARSTDAWLATLTPAQSDLPTHDAVIDALDDVRAQSPTRHG